MRSWPAPINRTTRAGTTPSQGAQISTFLIADVRGYTLFTQERGDEAAAKLAAKFADIARDGVEAREPNCGLEGPVREPRPHGPMNRRELQLARTDGRSSQEQYPSHKAEHASGGRHQQPDARSDLPERRPGIHLRVADHASQLGEGDDHRENDDHGAGDHDQRRCPTSPEGHRDAGHDDQGPRDEDDGPRPPGREARGGVVIDERSSRPGGQGAEIQAGPGQKRTHHGDGAAGRSDQAERGPGCRRCGPAHGRGV